MNRALRRISLVVLAMFLLLLLSVNYVQAFEPSSLAVRARERAGLLPAVPVPARLDPHLEQQDHRRVAPRQGHLRLPAVLPGPVRVRAGDRVRLALQRHRHREDGGQVPVRVGPAAHGAQPDRPGHREAEAGRDRPAHHQLGRPDDRLRSAQGDRAAQRRGRDRPEDRRDPRPGVLPDVQPEQVRDVRQRPAQAGRQPLPQRPRGSRCSTGPSTRPSRPAPPSRS